MEGRSIKDILSGLIFVGIGLAFGIAASGYEIGTGLRMGPGYFPIVLGGLLVLLGIAIVVKGFVSPEPDFGLNLPPWRGLLLVLGALLFFGLTVRGLGLVPTIFLTVFATALASEHNTFPKALVLAIGLTVFCVLIFSYALGLTVPLFGPWVPV